MRLGKVQLSSPVAVLTTESFSRAPGPYAVTTEPKLTLASAGPSLVLKSETTRLSLPVEARLSLLVYAPVLQLVVSPVELGLKCPVLYPGLVRTVSRATVTDTILAGEDAGGPSTAGNLSHDLASREGLDFLADADLYLNGELLTPGTVPGERDYYEGASPEQWRFEKNLAAIPGRPNVLTQILWSRF